MCYCIPGVTICNYILINKVVMEGMTFAKALILIPILAKADYLA
jgi:hypothetical protein